MRAVFGLAGLLITLGVVVWILKAAVLPYDAAALHAGKNADEQVKQIAGLDENGFHVEKTYGLAREVRGDGKLQTLRVSRLDPGSPMETYFGLKANDIITGVRDGHEVDTQIAGSNDPEGAELAVREAYTTQGQLTVQRGTLTLTLPRDRNMKEAPPVAKAVASPMPQPAAAQQSAPQPPQAANPPKQPPADNGQDETMKELNQRMHQIPGF